MAEDELHIIAAIRTSKVTSTGYYFSHRYTGGAPSGEAILWAMSDGTVRWRLSEEEKDGQ